MTGSSVTFHKTTKDSASTQASKKTTTGKTQQTRTSCFDRLGSSTQPLTMQRTITQDTQSVEALAGEAGTVPTCPTDGRPMEPAMLEQQADADGLHVGACLAGFAHQWRSLLGTCRAPSTVEEGVGLNFVHQPQLTHHSIAFRTRNSLQDLQQALDALLSKGAIERVLNESSIGFYSRLFLVAKKTGDLRPVIKLSMLNQHLKVRHFKKEIQASVRAAIRSQEWTVSTDIRDAYLHVPLHRDIRKYMRFRVNKRMYQFTCVPFELATSPREFAKLLRPVVAWLRQRGVKLHVYLDDWLICTESPEQAQLHSEMTIMLLQRLGWVINLGKSDLTPSQDFQFLGMQFNTRQFTVAPLPKMHLKVQSVHQHRMTNPVITACDLHRLLGMVVFMAMLVRRGRLHLQPVQWWATTAWCQRTENWSDRITVPQWVLQDVGWWASPAVLQGLPLATQETEVTLFTDASNLGWGAPLGSRSIQGQWSASLRSSHINVLEMQAVINAVRGCLIWGPGWFAWCVTMRSRLPTSRTKGAHMILHSHATDYTSAEVVQLQGDQAGSSPSARSAQCPGGCTVQNLPDSHHRVAMERLRPVFAKWGEPQIDMFATFANRRLIKLVSPYPEPREEWTDAMSISWDNGRGLLFAFPPFKLVPQFLQKIYQSQGVQMILGAPMQETASWYPELLELSQEDPIPLYVQDQPLLTQDVIVSDGGTETRHYRPSNLHVWRLCGPS